MSTTNFKLTAFRRWAREAPYEAVFVYHRTPAARDTDLFAHARKLSDAGLVFLFQRRAGREFEYCARRVHHKHHFLLDKVGGAVKVHATTAYLAEEGVNLTGGRPRKIRQEITA